MFGRHGLLIWITCAVVGGAALAAPARAEGKRIALVIGNADYIHVPKLRTPKADADLVADALRSAGFAVAVRSDLTRSQMLDALQSYTRDAQNADWALFYFSGFGLQVVGRNYFIPVDAQITQATDLESQGVTLDSVVAAGAVAKELNVVVLDAGRDNPFPSATTPPPIAAGAPSGGGARTIVLYATSSGGVASDGTGPTSPFSTAFAKNVRVTGLELKMLFSFLRDDVMAATNRVQQPFIYGALPVADLFFIAK